MTDTTIIARALNALPPASWVADAHEALTRMDTESARLKAEVERLNEIAGNDGLVRLVERAEAAEQALATERAKVESLTAEVKRLRQGLAALGLAMQRRSTEQISKTYGGNTPEDWCGEADALTALLRDLTTERAAREQAERRLETAHAGEECPGSLDECAVCSGSLGKDYLAANAAREQAERERDEARVRSDRWRSDSIEGHRRRDEWRAHAERLERGLLDWKKSYNQAVAMIDQAKARAEAAEKERDNLRQIIREDGLECLDSCNGAAHAEDCPVVNYGPAFLAMKARADAAEARVRELEAAIDDALQAWSFRDQHHTHTWHSREDWVERHRAVQDRRLALRAEGRDQ